MVFRLIFFVVAGWFGRVRALSFVDRPGLEFYGPGEWARQKHGEKHRSWRKVHIAMDADTGEILAHELTGDDTSDEAMVTPLMANVGGRIRRVLADGAYDGQPTHDASGNVDQMICCGSRGRILAPSNAPSPHPQKLRVPEVGPGCFGKRSGIGSTNAKPAE